MPSPGASKNNMLTIEKCREILGKEFESLTDEEIKKFRDGWYQIINTLIDDFVEREEKNKGKAKDI